MEKNTIIKKFSIINSDINKLFQKGDSSYNYSEYFLKNYQGKKQLVVRGISKTKGIPTIYTQDLELDEQDYLWLLEHFAYNIIYQRRKKAKVNINTLENSGNKLYYFESFSHSLSLIELKKSENRYSITTDNQADFDFIMTTIEKLDKQGKTLKRKKIRYINN